MKVGTGKIEIVKRPHMVLNRDYLQMLEAADLINFDRLYNFQGGFARKQKEGRFILRMEILDSTGNRLFYLKRHDALRSWIRGITNWSGSDWGASPGMYEFICYCKFRENGIPTAVPVAAGERRVGFGLFESFLITESYLPYVTMQEIIDDYTESLKGAEGQVRKERLIKAVALLARKMHDRGFNHCDFNSNHVLVGPDSENGEFDLALFDLQRVDRKKWLRLKWLIKTIAHLSFSMPEPIFSDQDRLLLFHTYKGSSAMQFIDRFQLYWIRKKIQKISRHTEKIKKRRERAAKSASESTANNI